MDAPMGDPDISNDVAPAATGRSPWSWAALLAGWGAPRSGQAEIARVLADEHGLSGWWTQVSRAHDELAEREADAPDANA